MSTDLLDEYHALLVAAEESSGDSNINSNGNALDIATLSWSNINANSDIDNAQPPPITSSDTLVVVDMQHDFLPGGAFGVDEGDATIEGICELIQKFHNAGKWNGVEWSRLQSEAKSGVFLGLIRSALLSDRLNNRYGMERVVCLFVSLFVCIVSSQSSQYKTEQQFELIPIFKSFICFVTSRINIVIVLKHQTSFRCRSIILCYRSHGDCNAGLPSKRPLFLQHARRTLPTALHHGDPWKFFASQDCGNSRAVAVVGRRRQRKQTSPCRLQGLLQGRGILWGIPIQGFQRRVEETPVVPFGRRGRMDGGMGLEGRQHREECQRVTGCHVHSEQKTLQRFVARKRRKSLLLWPRL